MIGMKPERIKELRAEIEAERIDLSELSEIGAAFAELPDNFLQDERENATAADQLDELERWNQSNRVARDFTDEFAELANFFARFEDYKPMAVYVDRSNERRYSWPTGETDEADYKDKNDDLRWIPALGSSYYMLELDGGLMMKRDRAEAEALEIAKRLKKALEKI